MNNKNGTIMVSAMKNEGRRMTAGEFISGKSDIPVTLTTDEQKHLLIDQAMDAQTALTKKDDKSFHWANRKTSQDNPKGFKTTAPNNIRNQPGSRRMFTVTGSLKPF